MNLYNYNKSSDQADQAVWYWKLIKDMCLIELIIDAKEWFCNEYLYYKKYKDDFIF